MESKIEESTPTISNKKWQIAIQKNNISTAYLTNYFSSGRESHMPNNLTSFVMGHKSGAQKI